MVLETIKQRMNYRVLHFNDTPVVLYNSHRCIVPVLWQAANENLVKTPCNLVYFDHHSDARKPQSEVLDFIKEKTTSGQTKIEDIFKLTEFLLSSMNRDWLRALMELNLVRDAIWIGNDESSSRCENYIDHQGQPHKLHNIPYLGGIFDFQGKLADKAREGEFQPLWDALGWEFSEGRFHMKTDEPIFLDFDLDYFSFDWRGISKAWLPEFFKYEFGKYSCYEQTRGWTGRHLVETLMARAPLITIAKEPVCCGGELEVISILKEVNRIFFDGSLQL